MNLEWNNAMTGKNNGTNVTSLIISFSSWSFKNSPTYNLISAPQMTKKETKSNLTKIQKIYCKDGIIEYCMHAIFEEEFSQ